MLVASFRDLNKYLVSQEVYSETETERQCYYPSKKFLGLHAKKYKTPSNCFGGFRSIRFSK